jgi:hypothetical protein
MGRDEYPDGHQRGIQFACELPDASKRKGQKRKPTR